MSRRKNRDLSRQSARKEPYDIVLIVCEGTKTEIQYFNSLIACEKLSSVNISVMSGKDSDPLHVVNTAIEEKKKQAKYLSFDKVYCVIDGDRQERFNEAQNKAKDHNIELIVSYPCVEYWYICHFVYHRSPIVQSGKKSSGDNCVALLNTHWQKAFKQKYTKNLQDIYQQLSNRLEIALKNAERAYQDAQKDKEANPSTQLHNLVAYLKGIKNLNR